MKQEFSGLLRSRITLARKLRSELEELTLAPLVTSELKQQALFQKHRAYLQARDGLVSDVLSAKDEILRLNRLVASLSAQKRAGEQIDLNEMLALWEHAKAHLTNSRKLTLQLLIQKLKNNDEEEALKPANRALSFFQLT